MDSHNFSILETKVRQAIEEINNLKQKNTELQDKLDKSDSGNQVAVSDINESKQNELLNKVNEMLEVLDQL
ncbi:MAG: hypothetical protein IIB39_02460 [Candidatus Marinimicrobia bacterium]|nr:hypothetical protein [Candidatus Neomarinimicrobiota bacterium]